MKKVLFTATVDSHILHFHLPYLKLFKENGYEVHVATNGNEEIPYCNKKHTVTFERSPYKINNLKAIKQLKKIIDEEKFEIIHCHTPMGSVITRLAAKNARKKGTRVIYTAHGFHFYKGAPLLNWLLFYPVEKYLSKYTDTLITINDEDYQLAKKKFKKTNVEYVPGVGIDPQKFDIKMTDKEKIELRKELGLEKDDFVMIFPARLDKNKNQIFLIDAMKKITKQRKNIHLLLPGYDELDGYYQKITEEKKLQNNIHFLGQRNDIPNLLRISNLAVSSSLREGLGLNLIESIYCNIPGIAYDNRGHKEIIQDNNGYLFKTEEEFINKVEEVYQKKDNKKRNISSTVEKFMLPNCLETLNKIYFNNENKLLFIHTAEKIKEDELGNFYTDGCYNNEIWNRYLKLSPKIQVIFRKEKKIYNSNELSNKFHKLNKEIELTTIENRNENIKNFLSLKIFINNRKIIKNAVRNSNTIIARVPCDEAYLAIKYAKKFGKKSLIEVVGCPLDTLWNYNFKGKLLAIPSYLKMKKAVYISDYVMYVTNSFLQKRYPTKGKELGCSDVHLNEFEEQCLKNRIAKIKNNKISEKIIISTVGTVGVLYKGQQDVIKSIAKLNKKGYNFEYWIIGAGNRNYLEKIAKKYKVKTVKFLGFLNHDEIFDILDKTDIYIQPSYTEGLCRALLEALSRACPCIASNAGGNIELVNENFIYKKRNIKELTKKILSISEISTMKEQAIINYETAKKYKKEILDKKRNEFYKKFIEEKKGVNYEKSTSCSK